MLNLKADVDQNNTGETQDFSLVLGGPLYQILRRSHLSGNAMEMVYRRIIGFVLITWLPLLILSMIDGLAWSGRRLPFLYDIDSQCRFLVALPLFIYAELIVHVRMRRIVAMFLERNLITPAQREKFFAIIESFKRLRNSIIVELLIIVIVYVVGVHYIWRQVFSVQIDTWNSPAVGGGKIPLAGLWFLYISLPFFQFIMFRWLFRLILLCRFLWHVSRLDLQLVPTHPDLCGGLGFLANTVYAFIPLLLGLGVLFSGSVANWILYEGGKLLQYKLEILAVVALGILLVLGPLLVFAPCLSAARRKGLAEYGTLAQHYVREFDKKWLRGGASDGEPLIGSADIQSLADLNNSFDVIRNMRLVPFSKETIFQLAIITLLPFLPLTLTMFSLEELIDRLLKSVF
ncbi:MAG TPA: hypothetical protein VLH08_11480 [Acidobacteriota bacterium]|nr:hypothetical protein [Acidobacteriota bacterium]